MTRIVRALVYGLLMAVTPALCWGASFNGVSYVDSGDVVLGQWNSQFTKAKNYAAKYGVPIVVVWVNPGCGYCNNFEQNVMANATVKTWMQSRKYVFVIAINGKTAESGDAFDFVGGGAYPRARVVVKKSGTIQSDAKFTARMTASEFMSKVDGVTGGSGSSSAAGSGSGSGSTTVTTKTYALKLTASPTAGGKLSGAGSYAAGKTVTLQAKANSGYVFAGWYAGSTLKSQAASYKVTTGSAASTLTGKFILKSADKVTSLSCPLKSSYVRGTKIADVAVVVTATSLPTVMAAGLPPGLSYSSSTGKISGKPTKSGIYTPVITAKSAAGVLCAVTNEVVVRASGEQVLNVLCDAATGTASGAGVYAAGKRVTLRATPAKNHVFLGWYDGSSRLSETKSYVYSVPSSDKTLTAEFTTAAKDAAAVMATVNGLSFGDKVSARSADAICGVAVSWPISASGLSTTTVSVSGLPSGLSYSAKTGLVTGVPTAAQTKAVKLVAKTAGGTTVTYRLDVTVRALPVWASGTFNGGGDDGMLTLTVSSAGKISGKYLADGTNWTLSAKSYAAYDAKKSAFSAEVQAKYGKVTQTHLVTMTGDSESLLGKASCERFTGWWNGWKHTAYKDIAKVIDRATNVAYQVALPVPGKITLSFGASGTVTAKGVFVVGTNVRTGKDIAYSASCSTSLCHCDGGDRVAVYLYFPPKKGSFDGYADSIELVFDGKNLTF